MKKLSIIILAILISSCSATQKVVSRQKELMAQHQNKIISNTKKPAKKSLKRKRQALTVSVIVGLVWLSALNHFGSGDTDH